MATPSPSPVLNDVAEGSITARLDKLYEFERAPVTPDKLHDGRYFAAMFSGEHVAGTEFVIGALFVQWGASARDLFLGLLLGNLLAVLSWAFICAPIAVRTRLTLYWYARRIIGPGLTVIYNIINALLYCFLAAAMIGVSASAVGLGLQKLGIPFVHPNPNDLLPNSLTWVLIVLVVGALVITLAIAGFKRLSQFSAVCAPWMFPIFLAGALATLPRLGDVNSLGEFWRIAEEKVWTGRPLVAKAKLDLSLSAELDAGTLSPRLLGELARVPAPEGGVELSDKARLLVDKLGQEWRLADVVAAEGREVEKTYLIQKAGQELRLSELEPSRLGFWHLVFFAWFCNLAMHVGLSDMAVFRYARKWTYGFYSAFGMYLGHYAAWACAGVMGAVIWGEVNPGKMADTAAGMAGLLCVLLAGWTTANPTIYRAGLALQILTANWPRWKITLVAGTVTTLAAVFPAIFNRLLNFVAIYGLMLMPIGAIIFTEHWLFPKLGLRPYWTERRRLAMNPAALITWLVVLVLAFPIEDFTGRKLLAPMEMLGIHLFFRWLPGWFLSVLLYILLCYVVSGPREQPAAADLSEPAAYAPAGPSAAASARDSCGASPQAVGPATWVAGAIALLALIACVVLPIWVLVGGPEPATYEARLATFKTGLVIATIIYFIAGSYYAARRERARAGG